MLSHSLHAPDMPFHTLSIQYLKSLEDTPKWCVIKFVIQYGSSANLRCTRSCFMLRFSLYCLFCFSPPFPFLLLCLHHHRLLLLLWVLISFYVMECWWVVLSLITANSIIKSLHGIFDLLFLKKQHQCSTMTCEGITTYPENATANFTW